METSEQKRVAAMTFVLALRDGRNDDDGRTRMKKSTGSREQCADETWLQPRLYTIAKTSKSAPPRLRPLSLP